MSNASSGQIFLPSETGIPVARPVSRKERKIVQTVLFVINLLAAFALAATLLLLYGMPERMAELRLTEQTTRMLTLDLVSLLLLVAWLRRNLSPPWRAMTLGAAFLVLAESWLVRLS